MCNVYILCDAGNLLLVFSVPNDNAAVTASRRECAMAGMKGNRIDRIDHL